ncbi:MAG: potassium channel family protein [Betaproteobacteria bacterium]
MVIARLFKAFYAHVSRLSWDALGGVVVLHLFISYIAMRQFESGEITDAIAFWYFYVTTATTVGYGDISPKSHGGRLLTTLWIMPGGIVLFTVGIAKLVHFIADRWRKRMRGEADYSYLANHIIILGWQGRRTQRMIEEIIGDVGAERREIVLCTTKEVENPLPDLVKFVRDRSLNAAALHKRAGAAGAAIIIALGHDDNDTLAAALAAAAVNRSAHVVAYFEQQSFADLLMAHCPHAEAMVSMSMEMMVRSAQDPGSSRVHQDLLSVVKGQTQFSMRIPAGAPPLRYGKLFSVLKERHNATLVAVAEDVFGKGLELNAPADHPVGPGAVIYYIAAKRVSAERLNLGSE